MFTYKVIKLIVLTRSILVLFLSIFCSNEEIYICNDGNNAVDTVMQKYGELIKLNPQKVMEAIAQYRCVCIGSANDTPTCTYVSF